MNIFASVLNIYTKKMSEKLQRQMAIRRLIGEHNISGQESLLYLLEQEGFALTQATLSRDMKAMKIAKRPSQDGSYVYILPQETETVQTDKVVSDFFADGFRSIDFSNNIAVIKTRPAHASSIASIIDNANPYEILGTIAGDDTIFIVTREGVNRHDLINILVQIMPKIKGKLI